jgi:hypothetical protein
MPTVALLRTRRKRPRCNRAAEQRHKLAASDESCHLILRPEGLPKDSWSVRVRAYIRPHKPQASGARLRS